jgi:thiol:disulfide interchange protein
MTSRRDNSMGVHSEDAQHFVTMGVILAPRFLVVGLIASMYPCILPSIRIDKLYELDDRSVAPHIRA